ncbi:transcriptional regulator with XRE-family HTH domain [Allocatelliglobosispora scoriae]|uniref:Transcriptional regulator with XRE-family HTH domain n=1 Tax=Allocatelliglobosispora scoriae TaxID=643052 RepID=A0A841BLY7_9ACTN|nr:helix-turn-helix transcriptional regulator [Allocatelliglobosispora scoriae]MBB5868665.1 transcriptional regulator with XRE-family HTH domain [Allocatelliglobosispora scoriae]
MRFKVETLHGSKSLPYRRGLLSGFLWKLIRESLSLTQSQLAEALQVDIATIQGWETGRRPLTAIRIADLAHLRIRLIRHGAHPHLFKVLCDAIEADLIIEFAIEHGRSVADSRWHPLAATVHRRDLTNLITWPFTGVLPTQLNGLVREASSRRGPSSHRPALSVSERTRFFTHLLAVADRKRDPADALLRRQATYLLAFDSEQSTAAWLVDEHRRALRSARSGDDVSTWVEVRSASVALARYGFHEPLLDFVGSGLDSDTQALANINYWAYWVGEVADTYTDDGFMRSNDPRTANGSRLLEHLVDRLDTGHEQIELYIHTLWHLLLIRPGMAHHLPELRSRAQAGIGNLDSANLTGRARQKLSDVTYALRLS